jgi:hypothetical protein
MKGKWLLILLVFIVILSGCTFPGGGGGAQTVSGNGIVITKFSPDFSEIRSGEPIMLTLSIQNVGGAIANNIVAQIFGGVSSGTGWVFDADTPATKALTPSSLRPADPVNNLPGESLDYVWRVTSPAGLKVKTSYDAGIRVYYIYNTSAIATVRFYTNSYLKSLPQTQYQSLIKSAGVISQASSAGPISISFSTGARPLVIYGTPGETYALQITFNNVGSGNAIDPTSTPWPNSEYRNLYYITYTLKTNGLILNCPKQDGTQTGDTTSFSDKILLAGGKLKTVFCTIKSPGSAVINSQDYTINVEASYGYFVESKATINVLPVTQ